MGRVASLIAKHWKAHWPSVLLGAGLVAAGLYLVFVNASYFFGFLLIAVGVTAMVLEDLSTPRYYLAYIIAAGLYLVFVPVHYFLGLLLIVFGVVVISVGVAWREDTDPTPKWGPGGPH